MTRFVASGEIEMTRMMRSVLLFALAALLTGCAGVNRPADSAESLAARGLIEETYRIGVDDRLQISVWRNPELSITVPVRPDGMISVPLVGDVRAGGLTPEQVARSIRGKLAAFIRDPSVTVIVTDLRSHEFLSRVRITGAVQQPRSIPFRQGMTVLDAILEAGGLNDFASGNRTKLFRREGGKTQVYEVELGDILNKGRLETNFSLQPGDVITVPERIF